MWLTSLHGTEQLLGALNSDLETTRFVWRKCIWARTSCLCRAALLQALLTPSATGTYTPTHFCISLSSPGRPTSNPPAPAAVGTTLEKSCLAVHGAVWNSWKVALAWLHPLMRPFFLSYDEAFFSIVLLWYASETERLPCRSKAGRSRMQIVLSGQEQEQQPGITPSLLLQFRSTQFKKWKLACTKMLVIMKH